MSEESTHFLYSLVEYPEELLFRFPRQLHRIEDVAQIAHLTANILQSAIRVFYFNGKTDSLSHIGTYTPDLPAA